MNGQARRWLGRLYVRGLLFRGTALIGAATRLFYRLIYPDFRVGQAPRIWGRFDVMLFPGGKVTIGDHLHMVSSPARSAITLFSRCSLTAYAGAEINVGDRVGLNGTAITAKKRIDIGDGTMIAPNVIIVDSDFHAHWPPETRLTSSTAASDRAVVIGKNVWIGMNTIVLKGSVIGDGSIIGAASVVSGTIPPNVVAAGNPARVMKELASTAEPV